MAIYRIEGDFLLCYDGQSKIEIIELRAPVADLVSSLACSYRLCVLRQQERVANWWPQEQGRRPLENHLGGFPDQLWYVATFSPSSVPSA